MGGEAGVLTPMGEVFAAAGWVSRAAWALCQALPVDAPDDGYTLLTDRRITAGQLRELARAVAALRGAVERADR